MKFDVIIGNPPYQMGSNDDRTTSRDKPIYNQFVEQAKKLTPRYLTMIIPSRWMASGLGLTEFRRVMLGDRHIRKLVDHPASSEVFPGVEIKGGVCYFLWDKDNTGTCEVTSVRDNDSLGPISRNLGEFDVFVRDSRALNILHKVISKKEASITEILSVDKEFGWTSNFDGFHDKKGTGDVALYYNRKGKRLAGWINRKQIIKSTHLIDKWKVMVPQAGSDGGQRIPAPVLGTSFITASPSVCTQTYLFFYIDSKMEAKNLNCYVQTKFFRFLVSLRKITQHATRSTYTWVPQQKWDKLWTDEKLYAKYGLTDDEIAFIESMIRPMDLGGDDTEQAE
jgi:site-specific DNA-methyltransferase (adenine-specific)